MGEPTTAPADTEARVVMPAASCRPADLSTQCGNCGERMVPEHAHYRCPACGWRDSCCDGPY